MRFLSHYLTPKLMRHTNAATMVYLFNVDILLGAGLKERNVDIVSALLSILCLHHFSIWIIILIAHYIDERDDKALCYYTGNACVLQC